MEVCSQKQCSAAAGMLLLHTLLLLVMQRSQLLSAPAACRPASGGQAPAGQHSDDVNS
jgi:hypothetical protein